MPTPPTRTALLHPGADAPGGGQILVGDLRLRAGRVHEFCGPARWSLAFMLAGKVIQDRGGEVFWIAPGWSTAMPNPDGFAHLVDPGRITFVAPERGEDLLWCLEEVLRAGSVALAVADLPGVPALTPVRRLHLAAETSGAAPLGVLLTPETGGAAGIESRWSLAPRHGAGAAGRWTLDRLRARNAPPAAWTLTADPGQPPRLDPGQRAGDPLPA